jgi:hypothetical protein
VSTASRFIAQLLEEVQAASGDDQMGTLVRQANGYRATQPSGRAQHQYPTPLHAAHLRDLNHAPQVSLTSLDRPRK